MKLRKNYEKETILLGSAFEKKRICVVSIFAFPAVFLCVQKLVSTISNLSEYFLLNLILKNELSQKDKKENSLWKLQRNEMLKKILSFCPSITHTKNTHKH